MHFRRAPRSQDSLPGPVADPAAGADHRSPRHADAFRHEVRLRGRQAPRPLARTEAAVAVGALHPLAVGHARGRAPALPDAHPRPGKADRGHCGAEPSLPGRGPAEVPLVHVRLLPHVGVGHASVRARVRADGRASLRRRLGAGLDLRLEGQGEDAPVHSRPDQLQPGASLHQSVVSGLQELRQLHRCASKRTPAEPAPLGMNEPSLDRVEASGGLCGHECLALFFYRTNKQKLNRERKTV